MTGQAALAPEPVAIIPTPQRPRRPQVLSRRSRRGAGPGVFELFVVTSALLFLGCGYWLKLTEPPAPAELAVAMEGAAPVVLRASLEP